MVFGLITTLGKKFHSAVHGAYLIYIYIYIYIIIIYTQWYRKMFWYIWGTGGGGGGGGGGEGGIQGM